MRLLNHPIAAFGQRRDKTGRRVAQRRIWPRWVRPSLTAAAALCVVLTALGGWLAWRDGWAGRQAELALDQFVTATAGAGLAVEEILVEGACTPRPNPSWPRSTPIAARHCCRSTRRR